MKNLILVVTLIAALALAGCQSTVEGVKEDSKEMSKDAAKASEATRAALAFTPKIKSAFVSNPLLNDPKVLIDVDSVDGVVFLKGHVVTQEQKDMAGTLAQQVIDEAKSDFKLKNELEINP